MNRKRKNNQFKVNTVGYWLSQIPDPLIRSQALKNMIPHRKDGVSHSITDALLGGFNWVRSPEGGAYWVQVREKYTNHPYHPYA